jgi:hypothetical protein
MNYAKSLEPAIMTNKLPFDPKHKEADTRDFHIRDCGSLYMFRPRTAEAYEWLRENTDGEWFGLALAVEPRYVDGLVQGIRDEGFNI